MFRVLAFLIAFVLVANNEVAFAQEDWSTPSFGFGVTPVLGAKSEKRREEKARQHAEMGLGAYVKGVPLYPANPGAFLSLKGAYAIGDERQSGIGSAGYDRTFTTLKLTLPVYFYKHELSYTWGRKEYRRDTDKNLEAARGFKRMDLQSFGNDLGLQWFPTFSTHLTYDVSHVYLDNKHTWIEHDLWAYAAFEFWRMALQTGPGRTYVIAHAMRDHADDLRASVYVGILPKLSLRVWAKYTYSQSGEGSHGYSTLLLPDQDLFGSSRLRMPKDSYLVDALLSADRLILFLGFGIKYQYQKFAPDASLTTDGKGFEVNDIAYVVTISI
jgi:hypothetical protein